MNETSAELNKLNDFQQYIELLGKVGDLLIKKRQILHREVTRLLKEAAPHVERIKKNTKKHALKFNVFAALGVTRKEVIQSRFLAYLLDPNEDHNQGALFLQAFLNKTNLPVDLSHINETQVITELGAGKGRKEEDLGRMDIVLDCNPHWVIVIENKVDAGEQKNQLPRYAEWLDQKSEYKDKALIFLTPTGYDAQTGESVTYLKLSYPQIAEAFSTLEIKAVAVRTVINQYISICKILGEINVTKDQELIDLLTSTQNIKVTLEIEQQAQLIRSQVVQSFGENIVTILQEKLSFQENNSTWIATLFFDKNALNIDIRTKTHNLKPSYSVLAEHVFSYNNSGWVGWRRPVWIEKKELLSQSLETYALSEKMRQDLGSTAESNWVGSKYLRNGKKGFSPTDIDDIIACHTDNISADHPLANSIANELWLMFKTYLADIEELKSFKQTVS